MNYMQPQPPQPGQMQQIPQSYMTPHLPHRPPFVAQIDSLPEMQQHAGYITGLTMHEIQSKANANQARQMLFFAMTQQQWQNTLFLALAGEVADYAAYILSANQGRVQPYNAIQMAVTELCSMHAAKIAAGHPGLYQSLSPTAQQDANNKLLAYQNLVNVVRNFMMSRQGGMQPIGMQPMGMQPMGMQPQMAGGMQNMIPINQLPGAGGGFGMPAMGGSNVAHLAAAPTNIMGGPGFGNLPNNPGAGMNGKMGSSLTARRDVAPAEETVKTTIQPPAPEPAPMNSRFVLQPREEAPATQNKENVEMSETKPLPANGKIVVDANGQFTHEGTTFVLSTKYKNPLSATTGPAWCMAYDPATTVVAYALQNGRPSKIQGFQKEMFAVEPYEKHETIHFLKPPKPVGPDVHPDFENARKAFTEAVRSADIQVMLEERAKEANEIEGEPAALMLDKPTILSTDTIIGLPTTNYRGLVDQFLHDQVDGINWDKTSTLRFRYGIRRSSYLSVDAGLIVHAFLAVNSWEALLHHLHTLKPMMPLDEWYALNDELTLAVNRLIDIEMGINTTIDSFMEDILELRAHIAKTMGETISQTFDSAARRVSESIVRSGPMSEQNGEYIINYEEICLLNVHSSDLTLKYEGKAGVVIERRFPEFHAFLLELLEKPISKAPTRAIKIATLDGKIFAVTRSAFNDNVILITTLYL